MLEREISKVISERLGVRRLLWNNGDYPAGTGAAVHTTLYTCPANYVAWFHGFIFGFCGIVLDDYAYLALMSAAATTLTRFAQAQGVSTAPSVAPCNYNAQGIMIPPIRMIAGDYVRHTVFGVGSVMSFASINVTEVPALGE